MKQLDAKHASALAELRGHPSFRVFLEYLKEDEREETQRSLKLDGVACHRAQGAVLKLQELQSLVDTAPSVLDKIKRQTG